MEFRLDDLRGPEIARLLTVHLDFMARQSPPEFSFALDLDALRAPEISFWTVWDGDTLIGCGALKTLSTTEGEIKSMHTIAERRGGGIGSAIVAHIVDEARRRGLAKLYLETGSMDAFRPARALYARHDFVPCNAFGDYEASDYNTFMSLAL
jgi:putative acetyltransferase